jgi:CHAT domain-containing protein/tetratricopeptide (TPR) repeat protein
LKESSRTALFRYLDVITWPVLINRERKRRYAMLEKILKWVTQRKVDRLSQQVANLDQQGQHEQAMKLATEVCDLSRQRLGEDHPYFASNLSDLATLYKAMRDYAAAEPLYRQAMEIRRTILGEEHPDFAVSLDNLAKLYFEMGNYAAAEPLYRQALEIYRVTLGEEHTYFATNLNNLATLYLAIGNYTAAEPLYRQALEIRRTILGEEHPDFALSLNNLATLYQLMGNYAAAEPLLRQALEIRRSSLGEEHPDFVTCLNNLAGLYKAMRDYAAAEPLYRQVLEIRRTILAEDFALSLNSLAEVYFEMGNYAAAEPLCRQALEIYRVTLGEEHPYFADSLNSLAMLYHAMGSFAIAEPLYRQALGIRRAILGGEHPDFALSLNNLATLYHLMGNYAAAEPLYRQALEIERTILGEEHPDFALSLNNLATLYQLMGNYAAAEPLCRQALEIRRTILGEEHPDFALSLNNLATLYQLMGNYAAAEPLCRQALEIRRTILGEEHPDFAVSLNSLAKLCHLMGNNAAAEPLHRQALEICRMTLGEEHPIFVTLLSNLATLYGLMGNYKAAEPLHRQALGIRRTVLGETHPDFAVSLHNLAMLYSEMGNYAAAEPLYRQALEICRMTLGEEHPDFATSLSNLAILFVATDRKNEAITLMQQVTVFTERMIGQIFSIGSESQRMAYLMTTYGEIDVFLSLVFQYLSNPPGAISAALELVLRRKAIGAEVLAAQRDAVLGGEYPALEPKLWELTTLRMQIAQKTLAGPGPEGLSTHRQLLDEWNAQKEKLEAELARQIPEMNLEQKLREVDRQAVALALPEGSVLIEFVRFNVFDFKAVPARGESRWKPARYLAFVLPAGEPDNLQMIDLGEAEPIDRMIATFRDAITGEAEGRDGRDFEELPVASVSDEDMSEASSLRESLFDPLLPALGHRKRLLLAPDGDLTRLPFEALPAGDGRCLINDYRISYLSAGRDVLRFGAASSGQPTDPLIAADPDFDLSGAEAQSQSIVAAPHGPVSRDLGRGNLRFARLPGTRLEGERIASMLGVQPWLEGAALEARIKACRSPRILHLATHGFFLEDQKHDPNRELLDLGAMSRQPGDSISRFASPGLENPLLRSGLALAGANTWLKRGSLPAEAEDGLLTAEDVSGLDLLATELVVLSACKTGLGEVRTGEGVFGLRRAFTLAGAKTLVMSLWKVPDQQTQELMEDFYRRILAGQPRADALREAQLAMKAKYPHPFYWGAFICQGNPGSLP